ncbi:BrnA antitoxin family protein [Treponema parvum]|uniref:BrnA antitoxin family protein n=1 Tax=Treponema parvum TaxID=138851 RepID=A0A975EYU0_9SPIR|nr:BrnA antitoxin family protein [Treponema parvum]QTQ11404.1 BrnA antitoxin family protein [Treponema parvum]QTQ16655.1 BrnA antitoxin family protein [Treponema parvum]
MTFTAEKLTAERVSEIEAKGINFDDIPELTEEDFARGHFKYLKPLKKSVSFRIDVDNLAWLQSVGKKNYQTRLNDVLRWARQNGCPLVRS